MFAGRRLPRRRASDLYHMTTPLTRPRLAPLSALLAALLAPAAGAQARTVAQRSASATRPATLMVDIEDSGVRQAMYTVRGDLRQLVMAQETFWRARRTYAPDVSYLPMFHPTPGIAVQIIHARTDGWTARATYGDAMGGTRSCAIWVGEVAPTERPATDVEHKVYPEAEVSCDGDGYVDRAEWIAAGQSYMTYALHKLMQSEARFYAYHHRFTKDASELEPFIWDRDVAVAITAANGTSWSAHATFAPATGSSCVVWHGGNPPLPSTPEDQVVCR